MDKVKEALNVGESQLISSKTLFEAGQYRDSITLSYYAMYSTSLALLLKKNISPKTHEGTLRQLAKEYVKTGLLSKESYNFIYNSRETLCGQITDRLCKIIDSNRNDNLFPFWKQM